MSKLFENQTSNGNSVEFQVGNKTAKICNEGTWNGAEIKMQIKPEDSSSWSDTGDVLNESVPTGILEERIINASFRFQLSNAGASTSLTTYVLQ